MRTKLLSRAKELDKILSFNKPSVIIEPKEITEQRLKYEKSFHEFIKGAWPWIEGNRPFTDGWHIQAIAEHMEAVYRGDIKELIINIPPRCSKSTLVAVGFTAWCWTLDPSLQFLYASYAQILSKRDSRKCRALIESPWYKKYWGHRFKLTTDSNTVLRFDNTAMGYRIASSVSGSNTGEGGDFVIADDANNAKDISSKIVLEGTNDWWDQVMSTRFNNPKTGRWIVIMQRLDVMDLTGHILSKGDPDVVHLCLPMEYEKSLACTTVVLPSTKGKPWKDPRKKEGELLWPARVGQKELSKLKLKLNSSLAIAGQLQQRPYPAEGSVYQEDWFKSWDFPDPPNLSFVIQSWDTALSTDEAACYSACTTWGVFKDQYDVGNVILLNCWKGKVDYPTLRKMAVRLAKNYHDTDIDNPLNFEGDMPDSIIIEAAVNGPSLVQDLNAAGIPATKFKINKLGDKMGRAQRAAALVESGRVWLPSAPPNFMYLRDFAEDLLEACCAFPKGDAKDLVDSMSQALIRLHQHRFVLNPGDYVLDEETFRSNDSIVD